MTALSTLLRPARATVFLPLIVSVVVACSAGAGVAGGAASGSPSATGQSSPGGTAHPGATPIGTADAAFAAVRARSPWFDGIGQKNPDVIGQAAWWEATAAAGDAWAVTVSVGWGDCQAGCIDHHAWQWLVAPDGATTFQSETGSPLPDGAAAGLGAAARTSGIGGVVRAGPTCPVQRPGDSACADRAVSGAVLVIKDAGGAEVARFTTDGSGLFRIDLAPGDYTLEPRPVPTAMGVAPPQQVTVVAGRLTLLDVGYDTGIR